MSSSRWSPSSIKNKVVIFFIFMLASAILGNFFLVMAFLCFMIRPLMPSGEDVKEMHIEIAGVPVNYWEWDRQRGGVTTEIIRSVVMFLGLVFLSLGFLLSNFPFAKLVGIIVMFVLYFSIGGVEEYTEPEERRGEENA